MDFCIGIRNDMRVNEGMKETAVAKFASALDGGVSDNIEAVLWDALVAFEGCLFKTAKGLEFCYTIKGNEIFFSRKEKSVTRASVAMALETVMELQKNGITITGPKMLKCFGASYLYPIFRRLGVIRTASAYSCAFK